MFKLVDYLTKKLSLKLCKTDKTNENYDYYAYTLEGIFCFCIYCIISITVSFILGYYPYIIFAIFCFLFLRSQAGGSHAKTREWCCFSTNLVYILIGISTYLNKYFLILFFLSFIAFTGLEYIPKYTKTATQHPIEKQRYFQLNYLSRLFIIFILNILFIILYFNNYNFQVLGIYIDFSKISCIVSSSAIMNRFMLTDLCFKLLDLTGRDIEQ